MKRFHEQTITFGGIAVKFFRLRHSPPEGLPESEDLTDKGLAREFSKQWGDDGKARLEYRRTGEAKCAIEIIERLKTLGNPKP
jgi:hypothetical protein